MDTVRADDSNTKVKKDDVIDTGDGNYYTASTGDVVKKPTWWQRFKKWFTTPGNDMEGEGGNQRGGIPLVTDGPTYSPTKQRADDPDPPVNIDLLFPAMSRANAGPFSKSPLDFAKGLKRVTDVVKQNSGNGTSDQTIVNENTGPAQKTNANGQPIDNNGNPVNSSPEVWQSEIRSTNQTDTVMNVNGVDFKAGDSIRIEKSSHGRWRTF